MLKLGGKYQKKQLKSWIWSFWRLGSESKKGQKGSALKKNSLHSLTQNYALIKNNEFPELILYKR